MLHGLLKGHRIHCFIDIKVYPVTLLPSCVREACKSRDLLDLSKEGFTDNCFLMPRRGVDTRGTHTGAEARPPVFKFQCHDPWQETQPLSLIFLICTVDKTSLASFLGSHEDHVI